MRVMIVDDERPCIDELSFLLARHPDIDICGAYTNPLEVLHQVQLYQPQVIFVDIVMPHIHGIDLANQLRKLNQNLSLVFVTAHARLLSSIIEFRPLHSILKPINKNKLDLLLSQLRDLHKR